MPLTAFQIAIAKVMANGLVILIATMLSLFLVVRMILNVPFEGSVVLWFTGVFVVPVLLQRHLALYLGTIFAIDGAVSRS